MSHFKAIILAAGRGTRMRSEIPKVLHKVCGKPVLEYVLDITKSMRSLKTYVVVGHGAKNVKDAVGDGVQFVQQTPYSARPTRSIVVLLILKDYQGNNFSALRGHSVAV